MQANKPEVIGAAALLGLAACALVLKRLSATPTIVGDAKLKEGNFLPVKDQISAFNLSVIEGSIPASLDGMFIRNGPNPLGPAPAFHWFEGWGMLHAVRIANGIASYENKYVETDSFKLELQKGPNFHLPIFNVSGLSGLFSLTWQKFRASLGWPDRYRKQTANTALAFHAGRFFALMEADFPHLVVAQSLTTKKRYDFDGALDHPFTAHPKIDAKTGELFFFGYQFLRTPYLQYAVIDATGKKLPSVGIDIGEPKMIHDFAITEHYAIFLDFPLIFNNKNLFTEKGFFEFQKQKPSRIGVLPRYDTDASNMKWFDVDAAYVFHTANAWEEENKIQLIVCKYDDTFDLDKLSQAFPVLYRYTLDMVSGKVEGEVLVEEVGAEFPIINEKLMGYKNRYIYTTSMSSVGQMSGVSKYDVETNKSISVTFPEGDLSSEFVFVESTEQHPDEREEDDGWLIGYHFVAERNNSELLILKARDLSVEARVALPQRVPQGFHGKWLTKEMLNSQKSDI